MPRFAKNQTRIQSTEMLRLDYGMMKRSQIGFKIRDFEDYYMDMHQPNATVEKSQYRSWSANRLEAFVECLLAKNEAKKRGQLDVFEKDDFKVLLKEMQEDENSFLKKMLRTTLLDIYDTMAGDLDHPENKENLNKAIALNDLYELVLSEEEKQAVEKSIGDGKAKSFLINDQEMNGNFSKTLKALFRKLDAAEKAGDNAEKKKWQKLCDSYTIRPYVDLIKEKIKEEKKPRWQEEAEKEIKKEQEAAIAPEKKEEKIQLQEEPIDVIVPEDEPLDLNAWEWPVDPAAPKSHQEALNRIREMSERLARDKNDRKAAGAYLKSRIPLLDSEVSVKRQIDAIQHKREQLEELRNRAFDTQIEISNYLEQKNDQIFGKKDRSALRDFRKDIQTELRKIRDLDRKMHAELTALTDRYEELRNPVGSNQSFGEAVEAFEAIQDRKLSWGRTGGHARQFDAIKEAVREWRTPHSVGDDAEKKMNVYKACEAYLREHANDGKKIGGQGSEVGRLRKQAVVNLLQVLSKDPGLQESLVEYEDKQPARVKMNFAELEKSLAKASDAKVKLSKYEKGTQKKAYAELKNAKDQMIR